jgi:hypothetical protein
MNAVGDNNLMEGKSENLANQGGFKNKDSVRVIADFELKK